MKKALSMLLASACMMGLCARLAVNNGEGDYYHDGDIGGGTIIPWRKKKSRYCSNAPTRRWKI